MKNAAASSRARFHRPHSIAIKNDVLRRSVELTAQGGRCQSAGTNGRYQIIAAEAERPNWGA
jgi:hypothetical protein